MPGLRISWMVAAHDILEKAVMLKQTVDLQTSSFAQRQASYYIDMYDLDAHVKQIRALYGKRRTLMYDSMKKYFPEGVSFTYPEGGMFTWVTLPGRPRCQGNDAGSHRKESRLRTGRCFLPEWRPCQPLPPELFQHAGRPHRRRH